MSAEAHPHARLRSLSLGVVALAAAGLLAIALGPRGAEAAPKVTVLGAATPANPTCPQACEAVAQTTGYQTKIGRIQDPFVVPFRGKIVAWSIKLGKPTGKDLEFFQDEFGNAQARLAILGPNMKKIKKGKLTYKLKKQSPVEGLQPFFGTTTTFTLQQPLGVKKNQVVALTVPTWAPALARIASNQMRWAASRKKSRCGVSQDPAANLTQIKEGTAQQAVGKDRFYGCQYRGARVLYSATLVKNPKG